MIKTNVPFIEIPEINDLLFSTVALHISDGVKSYMVNKDFNYIVIKLFPHNQEQLKEIIKLNEALHSAEYHTTVLAVIDEAKDWTPYYIKIEWNVE